MRYVKLPAMCDYDDVLLLSFTVTDDKVMFRGGGIFYNFLLCFLRKDHIKCDQTESESISHYMRIRALGHRCGQNTDRRPAFLVSIDYSSRKYNSEIADSYTKLLERA